MLRRLSTRLSSLFRRARYERELDTELSIHLNMLTEQHVRAGMPPVAARQAAMRTFGVVDRVNQSLARHYWPGQDPIGQLVSGNNGRSWSTIIGVVADARQQLRDPVRDELYVPMFQSGQLSTNWLVHSTVSPDAMERQIRDAIHAIDPEQPVENFRMLSDVRSASLASPTVTATLLGLFGLLALVITAAGIAGVVAFSVNQRTQEFGIRMALGAARTNVLGIVLRQGLRLVALGLALGVGGALVLTQVLTTLLFDVRPNDGITYLAVSIGLLLVAFAACLVPARRAASVDPMVALRVG